MEESLFIGNIWLYFRKGNYSGKQREVEDDGMRAWVKRKKTLLVFKGYLRVLNNRNRGFIVRVVFYSP